MTQDEIIEMAGQAGMLYMDYIRLDSMKQIEALIKLATAKEREACARACAEDSVQAMNFTGGTFIGGYFSQKIIARGEI